MANAFPVKNHASLEINRARFLAQGNVVSQLPLAAEFTESAPCENGMWVGVNKAAGEVTREGKPVGIVYTTEKEWGRYEYGLNRHYTVAGEYPRVGILDVGDTFTSNCFDITEFSTKEAAVTALGKLDSTPLYLVPGTEGYPKLTATAATSGLCAEVIKYTTMPNGEEAIKYQIIQA